MTEESSPDPSLRDELSGLMDELKSETEGKGSVPSPQTAPSTDTLPEFKPLMINRLSRGGRLIFKSRNILGVDIGDAAIKIVQVDMTKGRPQIYGFAYIEIPLDEKKNEKTIDTFLVQSIRKLMRTSRLFDSLAFSYISGKAVFVHTGTIDKVEETGILEAVQTLLEDKITFPLEEAVLKYNVTGESTGRQGEKLEITVVAAQKELVRKTSWLLEEMGLQIVGLSTPSHSFENIFEMRPQNVPENIVVINFGAKNTQINYYREGQFIANRELSVAGNDITRALMARIPLGSKTLTLTASQAEALKREHGVILDPQEVKDDALLHQYSVLTRQVLEKLVADLKRSLAFFQRSSGIKSFDKIYIVGGGSAYKRLPVYLKNELEVEVEFFPVSRYFQIAKNLLDTEDYDQIMNTLIPSCGLFVNRQSHVNLVPPPTRIFSRIASYKNIVNLICAAAFVGMFLIFVVLSRGHRDIMRSLNDSKDQLILLDSQAKQIDSLVAFKQSYLGKKKLVDSLVQNSPRWDWLLGEISRITPDSIIYQRMNIEITEGQGVLTLTGTVDTTHDRLDKAVSLLMENIATSPYFKGRELVRMAQDPGSRGGDAAFELKGFLLY